MKNLIIIALTVIAVAEGFVLFERGSASRARLSAVRTTPAPKTARPTGVPFLSKGMKLADSPLYNFAYQIAPGQLSTAAQTALAGWSIVTAKQPDGSLLVTLTPKDSSDQNQQYKVPAGDILYFIEQTPVDDKNDRTDLNLRDDYGVMVDQNGIVQ